MRTLTKKHIESLKKAEQHAYGESDASMRKEYDTANRKTAETVTLHRKELNWSKREKHQ